MLMDMIYMDIGGIMKETTIYRNSFFPTNILKCTLRPMKAEVKNNT